MLVCGGRVRNMYSLQVVVTVFLVAFAQQARCEKYIDKSGYLKWNLGSNVLQGAQDRLEFRFRYCNKQGVLIYQQGEGRNFFALGVNNERLYIEASINQLAVEMYVGENVGRNQTHDVTITGVRTLNYQTRVIINGISYTPEILTDVEVSLDFSSSMLVGETQIGGYESIDQLRLNTQRLKAYPITCITFIRAGPTDIDLDSPSSQLGVSDTCIVCLPPSLVTLTRTDSFLRMRVDNSPRSNNVISLKFRTKAPDGLLFYFGGPCYVALYLEGGALVLRLNTRGSGSDTKYKTTRATFNDGEMQEVSVTRTGNTATLRDGAGNIIAQVIFGGSQNTAQALNAERLYVGGFEAAVLGGLSSDIEVTQSFRGCLEELRFASYSAVESAPTLVNFENQHIDASGVDFSSCLESASCQSYPCTGEGQQCSLGVCECIHGYGVRAQDPLVCYNIDDCSPNPCQNGARCTDKIADYNCTCTDRYKGKNCSVVRNCYDFPCLNGAACIELDTPTPSAAGRSCNCAQGYKGVDCGQDCDECSEQCNSGICVNSISCENSIGDFICECKVGYEGKDCSSEIDYCKDGPCGPGICNNFLTGYNCTCPDDPTEAVQNRQSCGPISPSGPIAISPASLAVILVCLVIVLILVAVFVAYYWQKYRARMSQRGKTQHTTHVQEQQNTIQQEPVYQTLNPATYMVLQPPNRHAEVSTQTEHSAPSEDHAYQPLSRETMEAPSGYSSLQPTNNRARSSVNQGEDDYENPDQDDSNPDGHQNDVNEINLDLEEGAYLEIVA
ncbi:FAT1 [Branchiostoma lanceolatum]|uniref:FAT1 protein n=1 Tax=Branchiostoma lanceolatum TaxID=7740 RepID=A0A8J9Z649_BRALA|nr:FAT1 [Branchiostoma lanceolatum]